MGLLERAAMEAAKKMAENEESHTDTRGIVKASKVFPVVSIASILLALGMAFLKHRQSDAAFLCTVWGVCSAGHLPADLWAQFQNRVRPHGNYGVQLFRKAQAVYPAGRAEDRTEKRWLYCVDCQGKFGWNSSFSLVQMHFSAICGTIRRRNRYEVDICKKRLWDLRLYGSGVSGGDNCIFCAVRYK